MFNRIRKAINNYRDMENTLRDAAAIAARYKADYERVLDGRNKDHTRIVSLERELKEAKDDLKAQEGVSEIRMESIRNLSERATELENTIKQNEEEATKVRQALAHSIHFMHNCKSIVDGFVEASNRLPDTLGMDSELVKAILGEFGSEKVKKERFLEELSRKSYEIETPSDQNGIFPSDYQITVDKIKAAILNAKMAINGKPGTWEEFDPNNWISFDEGRINSIKELGLYNIRVIVGDQAKGRIKLWVVPLGSLSAE